MNRLLRTLLAWEVVGTLAGTAAAAQFKFPDHTFTVPDGFAVELAAGPSLVNRPIEMDFDDRGRLYVTDSSGSNDKVQKQLEDKPHRIVRLEDTDGDGRFDKTQVFADKMMFPEGAMWFDGSLYVSAPPSIWRLTDTDGDGVADRREEWFQGKTLTGCANDLHGPYFGPDGWFYWCKGAFAEQTYERPGQSPFVTRASHIFRARPDGSGIEPVMTGGMDNPVGVVFTPAGERIFTTTFFQHPGGGQRDGLIHAIYGGVYGKVHDVIDNHKRTGEIMPVLTHLGPAAPCGLLRFDSNAFGSGYRDNLFATLFNLHKVTRHVLQPEGATFRSLDSDFLVSDNTDFHPTDIIEDADGSLLVIDTGGWYKLCCPTSQLWKPDVLGAIYRIRKTGTPKVSDPRGLMLDWANLKPTELARLLADDRGAVRNHAMTRLARLGAASVPALAETLKSAGSIEARRLAVWSLTRIDAPEARQAVRANFIGQDDSVGQAAVHSMSVWRDRDAVATLLSLLNRAPAPLQRAAAEALGRIGSKLAVPDLLEAAGRVQNDRILEHSLTYALIEIADPVGTAAGIQSVNSRTKRTALMALDQMEGGGLKPELVVPLLTTADPELRQTASWIVVRHPEWGGDLAGFFGKRLLETQLTADDRAELERQLAQLATNPAIQDLLSAALANSASARDSRLTALRAMAKAGLKATPSRWIREIARLLAAREPALIREAVTTVRAMSLPKGGTADLEASLLQVARDLSAAPEVRLDALAGSPVSLNRPERELFEFLRTNLDPSKPVLTRATAANVLAKARLSLEQLTELTDSLKSAGPMEVPKLLSAFEKATNEALGLKLVAALKQSAGVSGLRAETVKPRLTNFPTTVQEGADEWLASLNVDAAKQKAHLEAIAEATRNGDVRRGQAIFNSQKSACSSCHAIGYLGGNVGPDLTKIGQIRTEQDLLEAIVYPSASFVRSYEPVFVVTKSGDDYSGVLRKDAPDEILLATGPGTEVRVSRSDITEMRPGTVSVMPGGLDEQLSRQELADLIAFLKSTKW